MMDESFFREQMLAQQKSVANFGVITHERGLDLIETSGWIIFGTDFACVYPDNAELIHHQPRVIIPLHRIVTCSVEGKD